MCQRSQMAVLIFLLAVVGAGAMSIDNRSSREKELPGLSSLKGRVTGSVAGCKSCIGQHWNFFECFHYEPPEDTSCRSNGCLDDHYWTFKCVPTPEGQEDECCWEINNNIPWRFQRSRVVNITEACTDNGFEEISELCASTCRPMLDSGTAIGECHVGKCFISGCSGGTIFAEVALNGRYECDPDGPDCT